MVHASAVRDVTLRSGGLTDEPILGLASIRHRICADSLIQQGTHHTFVCRAQSVCDPRDVAEGPPVVVEATGRCALGLNLKSVHGSKRSFRREQNERDEQRSDDYLRNHYAHGTCGQLRPTFVPH